ncbi:MAG: hypothetical protein V3U96_01130 [Paracoccaceae bacterium]
MAKDSKPSGNTQKDKNELVASYLQVRKAIGFIGIALPVLLILFSLIAERSGPKGSISAYYYSGGREILVGCLFAIGVFLFSYKGFDKDTRFPTDKTVSRLAAIGAIGVAFSPMAFANSGAMIEPVPTWVQSLFSKGIAGGLHGAFALLFFGSIATFCIVNFCRCAPGTDPDDDKKFRNSMFRVLGVFILLCTAAFAIGSYFDFSGAFVFWAEALAVWAFGLSWIIKGEAIEGSIDRFLATRRARQ